MDVKKIILFLIINLIASLSLFSQCPEIEGILVNACSGGGNEGVDEMVVFNNANSSLSINDLMITFPNGGAYCNSGCGTQTWASNTNNFVNNILASDCGGGTFIVVDPSTGVIPANAKVLVYTGVNPTYDYDFSGACSSGPFYVVFASNTSTVGRFANNAGANRTLTLERINTSPCTESVTYLSNSANTNTDGDYVNFSVSGTPTYNNTGSSCAPNTTVILPLPIDLIKFTASLSNNVVELKWTTATEINNDYFILERSSDGIVFEEIGRVKGAGNSTSLKEYSYTDFYPLNGKSYYRLKQVDIDEKSSYSSIEVVDKEVKDNYMYVFPIPVRNVANVNLFSSVDISTNVELIDLLGQILIEKKIEVIKGENNLEMDVSNLGSGVYILKIINSKYSLIKQLVIN